MDSWTNVKISKCVYHLKTSYVSKYQLLYRSSQKEKWGKDHTTFMLIMTWHMQRVGKHISTIIGKRVTQWLY